MPIASTKTSPLRQRDDIVVPPRYTSGRKAIWISSNFGSRTRLARDAQNVPLANRTSNRNQAKF
jgi:hypothetical protein